MNVLLSVVSETTTWVALLAVTESVDELPCVIALGLATIATVGVVDCEADPLAAAPQEVRVESAPSAKNTSVAEHKVADSFRILARSRSPKNFQLVHLGSPSV